MIRALLQTLRPHQWVKNLFVLGPLVFARELFDGRAAIRAAAATLVFCLLAGAVYTVNDVIDVERDRVHPVKRRRPVAAGRLSVPLASAFAASLMAASLLGAAWLGFGFAATASAYLLLNLAYSLSLKSILIADVLSIALGFVLRVLAGSFALAVPPSRYLLICTFLLALFLAVGKRLHERRTEDAVAQRAVLAAYGERLLRLLLAGSGALTAIAYAAYTLDATTTRYFSTAWLPLTIPFPAVGIVRFVHLVGARPHAESPTQEMLRDPLFLANLVLWGVVVVAVIYFT